MNKYIGVKIIKAEKFNKDGEDGYIVVYSQPDGSDYTSWSPKEVFEEAYRPTNGLTFGLAIEALKKGCKVARKGWNGKGMYLYLVRGTEVDKELLRNEASLNAKTDSTGVVTFNSHIDMVTTDGSICIGWLASQTDMLSEDWQIVE